MSGTSLAVTEVMSVKKDFPVSLKLSQITSIAVRIILLIFACLTFTGWQWQQQCARLSWIFYHHQEQTYVLVVNKEGDILYRSELPDSVNASAGNFDADGNINLYCKTNDEGYGVGKILRIQINPRNLRIINATSTHVWTSYALSVTERKTNNILAVSTDEGQLLARKTDPRGLTYGIAWKLFPWKFTFGFEPTIHDRGISYDGHIAYWGGLGQVYLELLDRESNPVGFPFLIDSADNFYTKVNSVSVSDLLPGGRRLLAYSWVEGSHGSCYDYETFIHVRVFDSETLQPLFPPRTVFFNVNDDCGTNDMAVIDRKGSFVIYSDDIRHQLIFRAINSSGMALTRRILTSNADPDFVFIQPEGANSNLFENRDSLFTTQE